MQLVRCARDVPGTTGLDARAPRAEPPGAAEHSWEDERAGLAVAALHPEPDLCAGMKTPAGARRFGRGHSPLSRIRRYSASFRMAESATQLFRARGNIS